VPSDSRMRVKKLNSTKEVLIRARDYAIDWEKDGASKLEVRFRDLIYPKWKDSIVLFQFRIPGSLMRLDFLNCNKRLVVEIHGPQHENFNKHFHNNSRINYLESIKRDAMKWEWCNQNKITVLELKERDLDKFSTEYIEKEFGVIL